MLLTVIESVRHLDQRFCASLLEEFRAVAML
jgi:hypothetical protein